MTRTASPGENLLVGPCTAGAPDSSQQVMRRAARGGAGRRARATEGDGRKKETGDKGTKAAIEGDRRRVEEGAESEEEGGGWLAS